MLYKSLLSVFIIAVLLVSILSPAVNASIVYGPEKYTRTTGSPNDNSKSNVKKGDSISNGSNSISNGSKGSSVSFAYGPEKFTGINGSNTYYSNFSIANPHGNYTFFVKNGDLFSNGSYIPNASSSSVVWFNGVEVFGPSDFKEQGGLLKKNVSLSTDNQIKVEMRSKPGSQINVWVEDESPEIILTSPLGDAVTNGTIWLAGYTTDRNVTSIRITQSNNTTVTTIPVTNGNFTTILWIHAPVQLTVSAIDSTDALRATTLDLDGDYLPMQAELLYGFDPLNPDSNSTLSTEDLAGNGIPDGFEILNKTNGELLPILIKYLIHGDPLKVDSNGNGLTDYFEFEELHIMNVSSNSSEEIALPGEDPDNDGLTNIQEQALGTDSLNPDTDGDGLTDGYEVNISHTDPLNSDTDNDGLDDASELKMGTDPNNPDSNGNGISDGLDTYTTTASNDTLGISVAVTGKGDLSRAVKFVPETSRYYNISALVSPPVNIDLNGSFDSATISIHYNPEAVTNPANLSLCYFNESLGLYVPVKSQVDVANHSVSANVTHFSMWSISDANALLALYNNVSNFNSAIFGSSRGPDVYLDGHSLNWPYDIRFSSASGVPLNYWVESYDNNNATVWVKVDSIPSGSASTKTKLNVFYGKAGDTGDSNGNATFEVFDHFDGSTLDSSKWQIVGTGTATVNNGSLRLSTYPQNTLLAGFINNIGLTKYAIETVGRVVSPYVYNGDKYRPGVLFYQSSPAGGSAIGFDTWAFDVDGWSVYNYPQWSWHNTTSTAGISPSDAFNGNFHIRIIVDGSAFSGQELLRNKVVSGTTNLNGQYFSLIAEKCTDDYDWVFIRKYTLNEPTYGLWGLEVQPTGPISGYSYMRSQDITGSSDGPLANYQVKYVVHKGTAPIDSDGDGLPDNVETHGFMDALGHTYYTEPDNNDTDGDGLPDGQEAGTLLSNEYNKYYYKIVSDPTNADTDGDGLTDSQEINGSIIKVADSRERALNYMSHRYFDPYQSIDDILNGVVPGDALSYCTLKVAKSNPLLQNSDSDGIKDGDEIRMGIDPSNPDTDGDNIMDDVELKDKGDPTVFDIVPPDTNLDSVITIPIMTSPGQISTRYTVVYSARDDGGIYKITLIKNDNEVENSRTYTEKYVGVHQPATFDLIEAEQYLDYFRTPTLSIRASDFNGNTVTNPVYHGSSVWAFIATKITNSNDPNDKTAIAMGICSGFSAVIAQVPEAGIDFWNDPLGFVDGMYEFIKMAPFTGTRQEFDYSSPESFFGSLGKAVLPEKPDLNPSHNLIVLMAKKGINREETDNPYAKYDVNHYKFAGGWALGYVVPQLIMMLGTKGAGELEGVETGSDLAKAEEGLTSGEMKMASGIADASGEMGAIEEAKMGFIKDVEAIDPVNGEKLLIEAETGTKAAEVPIALKEYESLSPATKAVLDPYKLEAERFLMKTRENGLDGRAFLETTDSETLQKLFSIKHTNNVFTDSIIGAKNDEIVQFQAGLVRVRGIGATPNEIKDYVNAITQQKVIVAEGSRTFLDNVINDNNIVKFRSDLFEAKTAAKYGAMSDTLKLIIQPLKDEADILVVKNNGDRIYVECKRPEGGILTDSSLRGFLDSGQKKFSDNKEAIGDDPTRVEIDAEDGVLVIVKGKNVDDVEGYITSYMNDAFGNKNYVKQVVLIKDGYSRIGIWDDIARKYNWGFLNE